MKIKAKILLFMNCLLFGLNIQLVATTTTIIIPCHPKHAVYLYDLIKIYEKQTVLPDEIVISISEISQINTSIIRSLQDEQWHFPVKLVFSQKKLFAGQNRNIACNQATGDIVICQDADDFPHPQRVEIIKFFFEKFNLDFLLHKFVYNNQNNEIEKIKMISDFNTIEHAYVRSYHQAWIVGYMLFGQPAFRREIFQKVQWTDIPIDEDNVFANKIITTFQNCMMIHCPLYIYRMELSATPYELYRNLFL